MVWSKKGWNTRTNNTSYHNSSLSFEIVGCQFILASLLLFLMYFWWDLGWGNKSQIYMQSKNRQVLIRGCLLVFLWIKLLYVGNKFGAVYIGQPRLSIYFPVPHTWKRGDMWGLDPYKWNAFTIKVYFSYWQFFCA